MPSFSVFGRRQKPHLVIFMCTENVILLALIVILLTPNVILLAFNG